MCTSSSATGRCRTPFGTTCRSPSPSRTSPASVSIVSRPSRPGRNRRCPRGRARRIRLWLHHHDVETVKRRDDLGRPVVAEGGKLFRELTAFTVSCLRLRSSAVKAAALSRIKPGSDANGISTSVSEERCVCPGRTSVFTSASWRRPGKVWREYGAFRQVEVASSHPLTPRDQVPSNLI